MATVQLRNQTEGRAYYDRRKADGKTWMEAMRALKRRLSNIVYLGATLDDTITATPNNSKGAGSACRSRCGPVALAAAIGERLLESGAAPMLESSASRGTNGPSSGGAL